MADDNDIRVGHPERERAISLLNDSFSAGYLEIVEFEERSGMIIAARTRGELRDTLRDLPNAAMLFPAAAVAPTPTTWEVPPIEYNANWETLRRKGIWQVPARVLVTGTMGTVDLDFTNAAFGAPTVDVQLQVSTTTVKIRVGPDQEIRYADVKKSGWSTIKDKAGEPSRSGGATVLLTGSVSAMSAVTIKRS